jgi:predicted TIM-barrel fold metal-dependent hydrolase
MQTLGRGAGNFPVDKVTISYRVFWNSAKIVTRKMGLSEAEKKSLFHDTAASVYGLGSGDSSRL